MNEQRPPLLTSPAVLRRAVARWGEFTEGEQAQLAATHPVLWAMFASGGAWIPAPHLLYLADVLMQVVVGTILRVCVSLPPQHGKSEFMSKYVPTWYLGTHPTARILQFSYGQELTVEWTGQGRDLFAEFGPRVFGVDTWARAKRTAWDAYREGRRTGGSVRGVGKGGGVTGRAVDLGLGDDVLKDADEADSPAQRERAFRWLQSAVFPRARRLALIGTRWHFDDPIGRLMAAQERGEIGEPWTFVNIPAVAESDDPLGRQPGEPLWPANPLCHGDPDWYRKKEVEVGTYVWSALYQGRPVPVEGGHFKAGWFRPYEEVNGVLVAGELRVPVARLRRYSTVDLAGSKRQRADWTVIATWGIDHETRTLWLLDVVRAQLEAPEIITALREVQQRMKPVTFYAERAAPQLNLVHRLKLAEAAGEKLDPSDDEQDVLIKRAVASGLPVKRLDPGDKNKVTRSAPAQAIMAAGRLFTPARARWLAEFKSELLTFPGGAHDDQVDALSYGVQMFLEALQASALVQARASHGGPVAGQLRVDW